MTVLASESVEYRRWPVRSEHPSGTVETITSYPVAIGFTAATASTAPSTWVTAAWDGAYTAGGKVWQLARILIGATGDVALAEGKWRAWVKVTGPTEVAIIPAGHLTVI